MTNPYAPPPQYPPQQRPPMQRAGLIIGLAAVGLAVSAVIGSAVAIAVVANDDGRARSDRTAGAPATKPEKGFHLVAPDTAGSWRKTGDAPATATLRQTISKLDGVNSPFLVTYQDGSGHKAALAGGTGGRFGNGQEMRQASAGIVGLATAFGAPAGTPHAGLDPGMIGGVGECSKIDKSGATTVCVWYADGVMLDFALDGLAPDEAGAAIRTLLPQVVTLS